MKIVNLKGQFAIKDTEWGHYVKCGIYGSLDFHYDGEMFWAPDDHSEQLDKQFGSSDWDLFEIIAAEDSKGVWHQVGDYGDNLVIQLINPFK